MRKVEAKPGPDGTPEFHYSSSGVQDFDGPAWMAEMMPNLVREFALGADKRVRRILAQSGVTGVLDEIGHIHGDSAKSVYFHQLLLAGPLSPAELRTVL